MTKPIAEQVAELEVGETWLPVPGFPDYLVSDLGRVKSIKFRDGKMLKPLAHKKYQRAIFTTQGKATRWSIHQLVMLAFVGPTPVGMEIRHLNGVGSDNRLENLAYGTKKENSADTIRHGHNRNAQKTHCPSGHPYDQLNTYVQKHRDGGARRSCKACSKNRKHSRMSKDITRLYTPSGEPVEGFEYANNKGEQNG